MPESGEPAGLGPSGDSGLGEDVPGATRRELLARTFDLAPLGLALVAPDGRLLTVNATLCRLVGYTEGELLALNAAAITHPDDVAGAHASVQRLLDGEDRSLGYQHRYVTKAGEVVWVRLSISLVRDDHGEPAYFIVQSEDVTASRPADEELGRMAAIVESSPLAIIGADLDGLVRLWNPAAERIYGYRTDEMVGRTAAILLSTEGQREEVASIYEQVRQGQSTGYFQTSRRRKDGRVITVAVTFGPVFDAAGVVVGLSSVSRDVTDEERAAAALAEAEERFRMAFEDAPIGMSLSDRTGTLVRVNDAFCAMTGYPRAQLEGMSFDALSHPDDLQRDRERLRLLLRGERASVNTEQRYLHASGHPIHVAVQATVLRTADGEAINLLTQIQDITDRRRHEQQLEYLADHDALTGLLNRRAFHRELESHAALVRRYGPAGMLLVIDLDQFKYVNDTLGHQAGDELIVRAAQMLLRRLRATDVLARLGGDEFGVLLPKAGVAAAGEVAESLLTALRTEAIPVAGIERTITASIGMATFDGETGEDALVNADLAMYDAKEDGRDRWALFRDEGHARSRMKGRVTWAQRIQAALARDQFTLLAQPIVELTTGAVAQYELLLRLRDETGELVGPDAFLAVAERVDLIDQIDRWVITHGIRTLAELTGEAAGMAVEINLSGSSLGGQKLLEYAEREVRNAGIDPQRLIFEVTETAALGSIAQARAFGERLSEIGCRFAIDDFGAGFGSFYYLKHLYFDLIKIDGEFVHKCVANDTDQVLIEAIVSIAHGLGKQTIAEYVGDDPTIALLTRLGVDYGQGYHLGRPAPIREHITAVRRSA